MTVRILDRMTGAIIGALALALVAVLAGLVDAGPLDPPGPPAPTLPQVEPRSPIPPVGWNGTFPIVINQRGSYFLTRNLEPFGAPAAISIDTSYVTLDLNGFELDGGTVVDTGIAITANQFGIEVKNGTVRRFTLWGVLGGGATGARYHDLRLEANGAAADLGPGSIIEDCTVRGGTDGVNGSFGSITIRNCTFFGVGVVNTRSIFAGQNALIEGNRIVVPSGAGGIVFGSRSTVRWNVITGETATTTYGSINFNFSANSVVIQNRFECGPRSATPAMTSSRSTSRFPSRTSASYLSPNGTPVTHSGRAESRAAPDAYYDTARCCARCAALRSSG